MSRKYREVARSPCPGARTARPPWAAPAERAPVTMDEPPWPQHCHPESTVCIRFTLGVVHSGVWTNVYWHVSIIIASYTVFPCSGNPLRSASSPLLPLLETTDRSFCISLRVFLEERRPSVSPQHLKLLRHSLPSCLPLPVFLLGFGGRIFVFLALMYNYEKWQFLVVMTLNLINI